MFKFSVSLNLSFEIGYYLESGLIRPTESYYFDFGCAAEESLPKGSCDCFNYATDLFFALITPPSLSLLNKIYC